MRRVLESKYFATSPKKTRFLEFVCAQAFLGNGEKLNEYLIGVEVYDRGVDFDAQKDPIVRVQAHEIRRLLNKYYEEDGRSGLIRLDLPSGHYLPVFRRSSSDETAIDATAALEGAKAQTPNRLHLSVTLILGVLCLALASVLILNSWKSGQAAQPRAQAASLPDGIEWFWRPFLPPAEAPLVTIPNHPLLRAAHDGDSAQTLAEGHEIPKASLPEFRHTIHFRELKRFLFVPSLTDFTSIGETLEVVNLCQMFASVGRAAACNPPV